MKIAKSKLKRIIKEELAKLLSETQSSKMPWPNVDGRPMRGLSALPSILQRWAEEDAEEEAKKKQADSWEEWAKKKQAEEEDADEESDVEKEKKGIDPGPPGGHPVWKHNNKILDKWLWMDDLMREVIIENSPLRNYKIEKKLGRGAFGIAFLLDNDHVLKLFETGLEGAERELNHYKELQDTQEMGIAEPNDPAIYDYGRIKRTSWHYVEMSKVIPLEDWFEMTGRKDKIDDLWAFVHFKSDLTALTKNMYKQGDPVGRQFKDSLKSLMMKYKPDFLNAGLTNEEANEYFKAVLQLINKHRLGRSYDVHHQNVGIMPRHGRPDEFVIFDF